MSIGHNAANGRPSRQTLCGPVAVQQNLWVASGSGVRPIACHREVPGICGTGSGPPFWPPVSRCAQGGGHHSTMSAAVTVFAPCGESRNASRAQTTYVRSRVTPGTASVVRSSDRLSSGALAVRAHFASPKGRGARRPHSFHQPLRLGLPPGQQQVGDLRRQSCGQGALRGDAPETTGILHDSTFPLVPEAPETDGGASPRFPLVSVRPARHPEASRSHDGGTVSVAPHDRGWATGTFSRRLTPLGDEETTWTDRC